MLLGAEIFPQILLEARIKGDMGYPIAIETLFEYIVQGKADVPLHTNSLISCCSLEDNLDLTSTLKKFWEFETFPETLFLSKQDVWCEQYFKQSTKRLDSGQFVVKLPFKTQNPEFGNTFSQALRRFMHLEARFNINFEFFNLYTAAMREYISNGYITEVPSIEHRMGAYYMPHHGILKPGSNTTKLRIVFDASCKGSKGLSLNEALHAGPKLQQDLVSILMNFRTFPIVFICDIKKMYLQILIDSNEQKYQRLLWRFNKNEPVKEFELTRVTFGVNSAPYLALRTVKELAFCEKSEFPLAAEILTHSVYVDDCVCGADTLGTALQMQNELILLLKRGGFELGKWGSNHPDILKSVSDSDVEVPLKFDKDGPLFVKVLGLQWNPSQDIFTYSFISQDLTCTKRNILSQIARILDPLGFIAPSIFLAKHLLQQVWISKCDWDEKPADHIIERWERFRSEIAEFATIQISRPLCIKLWNIVEIHGFCDASLIGYGAAIYFRYLNHDEIITSRLVFGKSKVAPLKTLSLPRLELCGAELLINLISVVKNAHLKRLPIKRVCAWTDSQIVLAWIASSPHRFKTFVANRISKIQSNSPGTEWWYIPSELNPADSLSRGLFPYDLCKDTLWWNGPSFLQNSDRGWPNQPQFASSLDQIGEERNVVLTTSITTLSLFSELLENHSSLLRIQHILAYVLRFTHRIKSLIVADSILLRFDELDNALNLIIKHVQSETFAEIIEKIKNGKMLPKSYRKLSIFLDKNQILRVGGRLQNAFINYDAKYPILLPKHHRFNILLIERVHLTNLHAGIKTMHNLIRQKYWILSPKSALYRCLSNCVRCFKCNPQSHAPKMGNLPLCRLTSGKAFAQTAVDFAGPYKITMSKLRGAKSLKAYLFIFVCCAVKAIHIELCSDLSSEACIAAIRRFIARRGSVRTIFSDQGTNFVGAYNMLKDVAKRVGEDLTLEWHFNPPGAPHFIGLAEAGVKSVKTHIQRVIGEQILTFEELTTLLNQVESLLNSRPLSALSDDPNDLSPLTPSHFLLTHDTFCLPAPPNNTTNLIRSRWNLIQSMVDSFWKRWSIEYLHTLQERHKWTKSIVNLKKGDMVLIKNELLPPLKWALARISEVHAGDDGIVRVVTVRTSSGTFKRPVVKICPLPLSQ